jgi:hypothetical protein
MGSQLIDIVRAVPPRAAASAQETSSAPPTVDKFRGKAVPSGRHFKQGLAALFAKLGFGSQREALVGKIPAVVNIDHLIGPSTGPTD